MAAIAFGLIAGLCAFGLSFSTVKVAVPAFLRRRASGARRGTGFVADRLRRGYATLFPAADFLLRYPPVKRQVELVICALDRHRVVSDARRVVSVFFVWFAAVSLACGAVSQSAVAAMAVPACGVAAVLLATGNDQARHRESARDAVPAALDSMAACFASGYTLVQTFRQVASDLSGPLADTFSRCAHILEMGGSAEESLAQLRQGAYARELAFVAVALDVQHQSGGAMRQVLEAASDSVRDELELRRTLRVQTAQAQLSARVVSVMPLVLVAAFSLVSPDFLSPFFDSVAGLALLTVAVLMQLAGIVLVRRALSVDGVS